MAVYTAIDDPSAFFQATTYTGNGSNGHVITHTGNSNLQADMVWVKMRSASSPPLVYDTNRRPSGTPFSGSLYMLAIGNNYGTGAENTGAYGPTAIGSDSVTMNQYDLINKNSETFVAWNWKANGGATTSVSASGTGNLCFNACEYQANTTSGVSVIAYTGRDDQLSNAQHSQLTHGLGIAPKVFICKRRDGTSNWYYLGGDMTTVSDGWNNGFLNLNNTAAVNGSSFTGQLAPNSSTLYLGNNLVNSVDSWIGYAFAEIQGFSKFSKYRGNGDADGTFVYTGFKPAFVMIKGSSATGSWYMLDNKRDVDNVAHHAVEIQSDAAEYTNYNFIDMLSNGFKLRLGTSEVNTSGNSYIYMAFAENPFVTSTGVPTTAR